MNATLTLTGAGKTNVALLTVLQALKSSIEGEGRAPDSKTFKIVYVAPLKSLVTEITTKFGARLECLGIRVAEFTGDMPLTKGEQNAGFKQAENHQPSWIEST